MDIDLGKTFHQSLYLGKTFVLPCQLTNGGAQFILFDSGVADKKRTLIFSTRQAMRLLSRNERWFVDGRFNLCPDMKFIRLAY